MDEKFVTTDICELHGKVIEVQFEMLRAKDKEIEQRIGGFEIRLTAIDIKIDKLLALQEKLHNYLLYLTVGVILTLIGVLTGRALDFGFLL